MMVKLFVGNLSPNVTSDALRKLFSAHGTVQECDVIKNYAFVHMSTDDEANSAVRNLDNHILEGRPIHIEKSTSRLRKAPGMSTVCFRCGAVDHKTPSCPHDNNNNEGSRGRRSPTTNGNNKRINSRDPYPLPLKRDYVGFGPGGPQSAPSGTYGPVGTAPQPSTYGYFAGQHGSAGGAAPPPQALPQAAAPPAPIAYQPAPAPMPQRSAKDMDPVLPRPADRDLEQLYSQYMDSRERYYYFREKLEKELMARARGGTDPFQPSFPTPSQQPAPIYSAATASYPDPYQTQASALGASQSLVRYPDMYYQQQGGQPAPAASYPAPQPAAYAPPPTGYVNSGSAGFGTSYSALQPVQHNPQRLY